MHTPVRYKSFKQLTFTDLLVYSNLPKHAFWSHAEEKIDFSFADSLCAFLYSGRGQHPYAPSLKLKIHLVEVYYDLSDRLTEEKIIGDLFIKRFLGLPVEFFGFDHSTIALDRQRMGLPLFRACHLYILAQMYSLGLWGNREESWIIDSFPCNPGLVMVGAYRLIQQAALRILQQLKRANAPLYQLGRQSLTLDAFTTRMSTATAPHEQLLLFSKLTAQAHALLQRFDTPDVVQAFADWTKPAAREKSLHLQETLQRLLTENTRPTDPQDDASVPLEVEPPSEAETKREQTPSADAPAAETLAYEKIPYTERVADRIVSAHDPDARIAKKTGRQVIKGYKIQNLCTTCGVILDVKVIPANEHDRYAMYHMVKTIQAWMKTSPHALLGDTCYGHGIQRRQLAAIGVNIIAPVPPAINPTGLYDNKQFQYNPQTDSYRCPNGQTSVRKSRSQKLGGVQHHFGQTCNDCPLREACTTNKSGRSVFHSDDYAIYQQAHAVNASVEGQVAHRQRFGVERKNAELKNHCGLGRPKTRSQEGLGIKAALAAIVVNLKHTVRRLCAPKPGFLRRTQQA